MRNASRSLAGGRLAAGVQTKGLVIDKKEQLVFDDGTAEGSTEKCLREWVLGGRDDVVVVSPGVCVQIVVFQEREDAAMEVIAAALHDGQHRAAVHVTKFGVGVGGDDTNLAQCIRAGSVTDRIVEVFVNFLAVEQIIVGLGPVAVNVDLIGCR